MNYDHSHHAGNHADVLKHLALIALIESLCKKSNPWCYLDTHAGSGIYDLSYSKTIEYDQGASRIISSASNKPQLIETYLSIIKSCNQKNSLDLYPGSTYVAKKLMRENDKIIACELNEGNYQVLKKSFLKDRKIAIHHLDGFNGLKAFLPPSEKRGLVLIDPPYEQEAEWKQVISSLVLALKRWRDGHFVVWYPIKNYHHIRGWLRKIRSQIENDILLVELCPLPINETKLYGSGLVIINPPWKFNEQIDQILPFLWNSLSNNNQGYFRQLSIDSVVK